MKEKKKRVVGKPFEKGNKAGKGRPPMSKEEKKLKKLTRTRFNALVRKYLYMTADELKEIKDNPETHALDMMVVSVIRMAITQGDEKRMNWFLEQLFGKLQEKKEVKVSATVRNTTPKEASEENVRTLMELAKDLSRDINA